MSSQSPFTGRGRAARPTVPRGDVVGSYETYPEAQKAVDDLARADFPVNRVSIVGSDLKTVERVTGKLTWGRVALAGAASGAWLGVFFGVLLAMFSAGINLGLIIAAVLIGAGFGMLFGVASYAINRRRRDFTSMTQVLASRYEVIVPPDLGLRARSLLDADAGLASAVAPHDAATRPDGVARPGGPERRDEAPGPDGAAHPDTAGRRGGHDAAAAPDGPRDDEADGNRREPESAAPPRAGRPRYGEYRDEGAAGAEGASDDERSGGSGA